MIEPGTTLQQRYRIDKQIGQGGMGAVYVATDERFGSTVAIKETLCMDDNFRKAIEREAASLLNSLKHSALPRVSDHFEEDNGQFLVMEYIPGDDVGSMLDPDSTRFTTEQVLKWADQLLDALDYLHNQAMPVIHRDIKPQNLKITPRGDMILLDFGLAKGNPTDAGQNTAAKSIFGYSRNYASLEQIQGTGTDPRSDLYSLAATLYHLLTNSAPEDALTRAMAVLSNKPDPLATANAIHPSVPRGVAGVLYKAMALNADERPATAAAMREMLRDHEQYGYLADDATVALNTAGKTAVFGQDTKLMPEATRAGGGKRTEAKTEVLPTGASDPTTVKPRTGGPVGSRATAVGFTSAQPQKGRAMSMVAGALMLLLVGGAVAGGLYLAKPSLFGIATPAQPEQPTQDPLPVAVDTNASNTMANVPAESTTQSNTAAAETHATTQKPTETTKNNKQGSTGANEDEDGDGMADVDIPEIEVKDVPGGIDIVKTEKGKTTVTHVDTVPKNFRAMSPEQERALRNIDPRKLTPAQRQKLQRVYRMHRLPAAQTPPETPDNE